MTGDVAPLWTLADIDAALGSTTGGTTVTGVATGITGVSIDSRSIQRGDLFVALKDQRDGHDFVTTAFRAGAAAALVANDYQARDGDGALIRVEDTLRGLEALGAAARARLSPDARVVAVTGSAGKTGTKEMLRACLSRVGPTHASEKSYNNHWGVPLTLARMPAGTRYAVFEIGMNHADEIRPLTRMVRPDAAIVTTVEAVHLEHFGSVEAIADAKAEIFEGLRPGSAAIIKYDNPHAGRLQEAARRIGATPVMFGLTPRADVFGEDLIIAYDGMTMKVRTPSRRITLRLAMPGRHLAENALAVVAALEAVGAPVEDAVEALASLAPPGGRGARIALRPDGGTALLIDESYNANPASMRAALTALATVPRAKFARRIAVLGDMLELGADAPSLHAGLQQAVEDAQVDLIFACGPHMKGLYDALPAAQRGGYAVGAEALEPLIAAGIRAGDVIMVKASNGTRLGPVVAALAKRFGDIGTAD